MKLENKKNQLLKKETKKHPAIRTELAFKLIKETVCLNQKLEKIGARSKSFGLKKHSVR